MTRKLGFTLAEVLITLGIIGVVAAMTIPSLMNQTGQAEFKTGMKKALSVLNQAITMNVALDGNDFSSLTTTVTNQSGSLYNMFVTRMNIVNTGGSSAIGGPFDPAKSNYTLFFNDGMAITFPQSASSCTSAAPCNLVVDVNGIKKPNQLSLQKAASTSAAVYDEFVFKLQGQQVQAYDSKAQYILYN